MHGCRASPPARCAFGVGFSRRDDAAAVIVCRDASSAAIDAGAPTHLLVYLSDGNAAVVAAEPQACRDTCIAASIARGR